MDNEDWDSESAAGGAPTIPKSTVNRFASTEHGFAKLLSESKGNNFESNKRDNFRNMGNNNYSKSQNENKFGDNGNFRNRRNEEEEEESWEPGNNRNGRSTNNTENDRKLKSTYVPEPPTENDDEIFSSCISSGINFDRYDDIEVKVSGENKPHSINSFEEAGLRPKILDNIRKCLYNKPTPIQKFSIPIVLDKRDMMACAQTGSGKTAAFLIPIIHHLLEDECSSTSDNICTPSVIVLSPTRELAIQIWNEARKFSRGTFIKVEIVYGGTAISYQRERTKNGCHILVATPGRLLDFVSRNYIDFSSTKHLVLDEADRMLDMGFLLPIQQIVGHSTMPKAGERQTLMFSATFPEEVQYLAASFLKDYLFVTVGIVGGACIDVEQRFFCVNKFEKRNKLVELLSENPKSKCLVFVERKRITDFIATFLSEKNFRATSIHGDREQRERETALRDFKSGNMNILVATSVAARGLDIKNVSHVVNFDLPSSIDEYVHRIGRTGRVGNRGLATSFYDSERDGHLASSLVTILQQAEQEVPDFLQAMGGSGNNAELPEFGGKDFRQKQWLGSAKNETFEDEVW
ncbi:hypothetical protein RUM43_004988 [Polyplax serrata]|uniref:RNA helicase n=1 Tax=Polyplax serrata TaxID=468196 RepID=A0AAN8SBF1_POLSC